MKIIKTLAAQLDLICAILGVFIGLGIIGLCYVFNLSQQDIGLIVTVASLIYLIVRSKIKGNNDAISQLVDSVNPQNKIVLDLLFYAIFLLSVILFYLQSYHRSLSYFVLIVVLAVLIAIEIVNLKTDDKVYSTLFKIILLSLNVRAGIYFAYPSMIGYDAYTHAWIADLIVEKGFVPPVEVIAKYASYPIIHLFIGLTKIICGIDTKSAIFYSIGYANIILGTVFIYLIGKNIVSSQVGLFSALLLNMHNYNIVRGVANITPGSLVFCYLLVCLYLIFGRSQTVETKILVISVTFIMVITHQLSTFVAFLCMFFLLIGTYMFNYMTGSRESTASGMNINYVILFAVTVQAYWMYTYVNSGVSFFEMVVGPLLSVLQSGGEYGSSVLITGYEYDRTLFETAVLHACYLIMPFLTIGGVLMWTVSRKYKRFAFSIATIGLYMLIYGFPLLGMRNLLTTRWIPLISILLVIISSAYIFEFTNVFKSNKTKLFVVFLVISLFTSLMLISPAINKDAPVIEKERTARNQFTNTEIYAAKTISNSYSGIIRLDSPFNSCMGYYGNTSDDEVIVFNTDYIEENATGPLDELVVVRPSTKNEPISLQYSDLFGLDMDIILPEEFFTRFSSDNFSLVYNDGAVLGYANSASPD